MRRLSHILCILATLLATASQAKRSTSKRPSKDAILLSDVKSLTLRGDRLTSSRRVKPIPQLTCVGGNAQGIHSIDSMRCKNSGSGYDSEDTQWTCNANLPAEFKLGSTDVVCEGYESPEDPYVLKGSCGVEYRLVLTELGEQKYAGRSRVTGKKGGVTLDEKPSTAFTIVFWLVFLSIVGFIIYKAVFERTNLGREVNRGFRQNYGGGGGGGGGGDDDDPPPPYTPRGTPHSRNTSTSTTPRSTTPRTPKPQANSGRWQPGFWTGAAAGAAFGYAVGNRGSNRRQQADNQQAQAGPSNWFNTGARNSAPSSFLGGNSGPSSPGPSTRYDSTGFGGTRRR